MSTMSSRHHFDPITIASSSTAYALRAALDGAGYTVLTIDGSGIHDKATFVGRVPAGIPGPDDPPTSNWDAVADWLWQAMSARDDARVAIVWNDAQVLLNASLATFLQAVAMFTDLAASAEDGDDGFSHPMQIVLALVGSGVMFPDFTP
jgi:hypothetical protein